MAFTFLYLIARNSSKRNSNSLELHGDEPELYQLYRYSGKRDVNYAEVNNSKVDPRRNDEVEAPIRAGGRRWKVVAGRQSAVFSFGRIARHPAVNPGRGDKPGDELVDATGSLVLIVRLLLVRVIPPPRLHFLAFRSPAAIPVLVPHCCLFVTHLSLLPRLTFSLSLHRVGLFPPRSLLNCVLPGARAQTTLSMAGIKRLLPFPPPPHTPRHPSRTKPRPAFPHSLHPTRRSRRCRFNVDFLPGGF